MFDMGGKDKAFVDYLLKSLSLLKQGIAMRLYRKYLSKYDEKLSRDLSDCIASMMLYTDPEIKDIQTFIAKNSLLLEEKLIELENEDEIKYAVTQGLAAYFACAYINSNKFFGSSDKGILGQLELHMDDLKRRGIVISSIDFLSPEKFNKFAADFFNASKEV